MIVAEDHPVTMVGLVELLRASPDFDIVASVASGRELEEASRREQPDAALVDLVLADGSAVAAIETMLRDRPQLGVIVLTGAHTEEQAFRAIRAGVRGYLTKSTPAARILDAVREVARGGRAVVAEIAADVAARGEQRELTPRELDVLRLLANGRANAEIGVALGISTGTVRTHVGQILEKLQASDRTEAAMIALRRGVI